MKTLKKLQIYMGRKKHYIPLSMIFSTLSTILSILPYIFIWLIAKEIILSHNDFEHSSINQYGWYAVISAIISVLLYFLSLTLSHLAAFHVEKNIRQLTMEKIIKMPLSFFDKNAIGKMRKIIDDNASVTHSFIAHQLPDLLGSLIMPLVVIVLLFVLDWRLGLACLAPIIGIIPIMSSMGSQKVKNFMSLYMNSLEDMNTEAVEYVRGIPVVKVFQQSVFSFKNFHSSILKYRELVVKYTNFYEKLMSAYLVLIHGFAYFLVPVTILLLNQTGDYKQIILNIFLYILLVPIFSQNLMRSMYLGRASDQTKDAIERIDQLVDHNQFNEPVDPRTPNSYDIQFSEVSFSYDNTSNKAIDQISFKIPEGKTYALVGKSGSGKSTIAKLIPRFYDIIEGSIKIGGIDIRKIAQNQLMDIISFVFQNTQLFKMSIRENVMYGNPLSNEDEVNRALDLAQCREIIDRLPNGLDTIIGSEGTYLSGGEQQRIIIARALLKNAPIIILDEATAFADPENEHMIQKAFTELTNGKTVLILAHRLTSITDVDKIIVMEAGKIIETGNHEELISKNKSYTTMWNEYQKSIQWSL